MATKQSKTANKRTSRARVSKNTSISEKIMARKWSFVFLIGFAVVGTIILSNSFAQTNIPSDPDDIVAAYYKLRPTSVARDLVSEKATFNSVSEGYLVLADGSVLCDNGNSTGETTTGMLPKGIFKKLNNELVDLNPSTLPNTIKPEGVNAMVSNNEGFILANKTSVKVVELHKDSPKPDKLLKMQTKIQKMCQTYAKKSGNRGNLRNFQVPQNNRTSQTNSVKSKIARAITPKVEAVATTEGSLSLRQDISDDQANRVNILRSSRGLYQLKRKTCMDNAAIIWAKKIATDKALSHSNQGQLLYQTCGPNDGFRYDINNPKTMSAANNWTSLAENVGRAGDSINLFNAYVNSPGHLANILITNAKCFGQGTYFNSSDGLFYNAMIEASWLNNADCKF